MLKMQRWSYLLGPKREIVFLFYLLILWSVRTKEAALNGGRSENSQVFKSEVRKV